MSRVVDHPLYQTWAAMHRRCKDPKSNSFQYYGALPNDWRQKSHD